MPETKSKNIKYFNNIDNMPIEAISRIAEFEIRIKIEKFKMSDAPRANQTFF